MNNLGKGCLLALMAVGATGAHATFFDYVDWTSRTSTTATGTIASALYGTITVDYTGKLESPTQLSGGTNYWNSSNVAATTYNSPTVQNRPLSSDILVITGENAEPLTLHTIKFSRKIDRIAMPIVSVGQGGVPVTYAFGQSFFIASQGVGHWGGDASSFTQSGNNLTGREAHGTIVFDNVDTISFTASPSEFWHGFTVGVNSEPVPEPFTLGLGAMGLLGAMRRRRARRS